jgi:mannose-6-phosphate isomerase-like protein (cupin superfamily)
MKAADGYFVMQLEDLLGRPSDLMRIPSGDFLERTRSEILGTRLWRLPPNSGNTYHRHPDVEEFYFVVEGVGRIRIDDETITVAQYGGVLVGPKLSRQVFNDTENEVLWLIVGAPEMDLPPAQEHDPAPFYPTDPKQLPKELSGFRWPFFA